jgi:hypothetical protein
MMYDPSWEAEGCHIRDAHSSDYEELRLLGCDAV